MINYQSFMTFLSRYNRIEIPIIQRDYAQGRSIEGNAQQLNLKGERFLDSIYEYLSDTSIMRLDIIYGSIEQRGDDKCIFIPLDGQQRLTTLWLLHWYIAQHTGEIESIRGELAKFSYATRYTSRKFCEQLCSLNLDKDILTSPSEHLSSYSWFTRPYTQDPTVQAMLLMLDNIAKKYIDLQKSGKSLDLQDLERIQFRGFDIGNRLADELYIKMNGRGRELSGVENLKADFVGFLKGQDYDFTSSDACDRKFDHSWADMAWGKNADKDFDLRYLRLFNRYYYNLWVEDSILEGKASGDTPPNALVQSFTGKDYKGFAPYKQILDKKSERLGEMIDFFDFLVEDKDRLYQKALISPWASERKANTKQEQISYPFLLDTDTLSNRDRLALYAQMLYVRHVKPTERHPEPFNAWMRIIWNLIIAPLERNYQAFVRRMRQLASIAPYASDIEDALLNGKITNLDDRLKHEVEKLEYLQSFPKRREDLLRAERHPCLQGQIAFLLDLPLKRDRDFKTAVDCLYTIVTGDLEKDGLDMWPALIALCEEPLMHEGGYLAHKDQKSGVEWRYQDLFNNTEYPLRKAWQNLLSRLITAEDIEQEIEDIIDEYEYDEDAYWHYPLVKHRLLEETRHGRLYGRYDDEGYSICLHIGWKVTENEWQGFYDLAYLDPELQTL